MYLNSRYAKGHVPTPALYDFRSPDTLVPGPDIVIRDFTFMSGSVAYVWQDGDRFDRLAEFFGMPRTSWWKILDANPQIEFPGDVKPGDLLWIPPEASQAK